MSQGSKWHMTEWQTITIEGTHENKSCSACPIVPRMSNGYVDPWDMPNNFWKSDRGCTNHRAGSQLKIEIQYLWCYFISLLLGTTLDMFVKICNKIECESSEIEYSLQVNDFSPECGFWCEHIAYRTDLICFLILGLGLGLGFIMSFLGWRLSYKGTPDPPLETDTPNFVMVDRTSPQT